MLGTLRKAVALLLVLSGAASADTAKAKELFMRGMAKYVLEKYDAAIADFEAGFQEDPQPEFLFNMAQAHKKAGRAEKAVQFYRKYLDMAPDTVDRAQVERTIAELEPMIGKPQPLRPKDPPPEAVRPPSSPPPQQPSKPKRRWPIWVGVGVGAAAVLAGSAVGVYFGIRVSEPPALAPWSLR